MSRDNLKKSLKLFKSNIKQFPIWSAIDTAAVVVFFTVLFYAADRIKDIFTKVMEIVDSAGSYLGDSLENMEGARELIAQQGQIMDYYKEIMIFVLIIFAALYVVWVISQSINWYLVEKKVFGKKKLKFKDFFASFATVSVLWTALFAGAMYSFARMWASILALPDGLLSPTVPKIMLVIMVFLISYLSFTSYALSAKLGLGETLKKTFSVCWNNYKKLMPPYIALWVLFIIEWKLIIYFMMSSGGVLSQGTALFLVFLVYAAILATLSVARICSIKLLEK
jgi:hypothetical protein